MTLELDNACKPRARDCPVCLLPTFVEANRITAIVCNARRGLCVD